MKKKIIIGSMLAVFLMLMLPAVSAVEYKTVEEANEEYVEELVGNLKDIPAVLSSSGILLDILIKIVKFVINLILKVIDLVINLIGFIISSIVSVIKLIVKGIGLVMKVVVGIIKLIINIVLLPFKIICKILKWIIDRKATMA